MFSMLYRKILKRGVDIIISSTVLIILSPILIIAAVGIKLTSKGPLFFRQDRVGLNKSIFSILKFRTMLAIKHDYSVQTLPGDNNVTNIGSFLRRFKVDELPQLINVLRGDMSLVGPRPCLPSLLEVLNEEGHLRFTCKPGLTGLAQVNGNIYLSWEQRWSYDAKYVRSISFFGDLKIIGKTFLVVILGENKFKRVK